MRRTAGVLLLLSLSAQAIPPCCLLPEAASGSREAKHHAGRPGWHPAQAAVAASDMDAGEKRALASMPPGAPCEALIAPVPALRERTGVGLAIAPPATTGRLIAARPMDAFGIASVVPRNPLLFLDRSIPLRL